MRIDFHAHILPRAWPELAERYGDPRWPRLEHVDPCSARIMVGDDVFRVVTEGCYSVERRLEDMAATGVDMQVLSTVPVMFSYWAKPEQALGLCRFLNDHIAETVRAHPDSFLGLGTVPLADTDLAIRELERCVLELGMPGVEIGTNVNGVDLDDERLFPFFERAAELDAVVFVHPWQVIARDRLTEYYFLYTVAMPSETSFALGALMFGGVLERLPALKLVFAHGGGSTPYIVGRMERGWEVWEPARERLSRPPRECLRQCWFDSVTWDPLSLEFLVRRVGAEQVVLGSDYPFLMGEQRPGEILEQATLEPKERAAILGGNCARLVGTERVAQVAGS